MDTSPRRANAGRARRRRQACPEQISGKREAESKAAHSIQNALLIFCNGIWKHYAIYSSKPHYACSETPASSTVPSNAWHKGWKSECFPARCSNPPSMAATDAKLRLRSFPP
eukprot:3123572-Pyramimonas_sp.AAC.1